MAFIKKTWLARLGVGLNRFRMNNSTDVVLESNPVSVTQQGDQLSADNMNNLETRIDNAFTEMAGNLAPIEVSPATTNHAVGTQIVYNGILYKVISAISTDDNLVVGTNISPYPVSSAISDIMTQTEVAKDTSSSSLTKTGTLPRTGYTNYIAKFFIENIGPSQIAFPNIDGAYSATFFYSMSYFAAVRLTISGSTYTFTFDNYAGTAGINNIYIYGYK